MKYMSVLLAVADIAASRRFYEELFGQRIVFDFGENVSFESGIALQSRASWADFIEHGEDDILTKGYWGELYFEEDELDAFCARLAQRDITLVHGIKEHPWGQRVVRLHDPDGHVIEVGESMEFVVKRFLAQGLSAEETAQKTMFPIEFVRTCMAQG